MFHEFAGPVGRSPLRWAGIGMEEALHLGEGLDLLLSSEGKLCYSGVTLPEIQCK
jgi:hypothetical protein